VRAPFEHVQLVGYTVGLVCSLHRIRVADVDGAILPRARAMVRAMGMARGHGGDEEW
jgi:hypothetical protein